VVERVRKSVADAVLPVVHAKPSNASSAARASAATTIRCVKPRKEQASCSRDDDAVAEEHGDGAIERRLVLIIRELLEVLLVQSVLACSYFKTHVLLHDNSSNTM